MIVLMWPVCGPRTVAAMRSAIRAATGCGSDLEDLGGAGDRDRTGMTSLEGWGSTIELRPRDGSRRRQQHTGQPGTQIPPQRPRREAAGLWPPVRPGSGLGPRPAASTQLPGPACQGGRG
jgi:hypothetical protein